MKCFAVGGSMLLVLSAGAMAQGFDFGSDTPGARPSGWTCGVTGGGSPHWAIKSDSSAPGTSKVLLQDGSGDFPWCVKDRYSLEDGFVESTFKPIAGREDQAGGVIWRWKDGDNYYVARANALEGNVALYYTERASRKTLKSVKAAVAPNAWHTLRVDFAGTHITVSLDGRRYIEQDDAHITGQGAVGVWTKADSVTAFSAVSAGSSRR